MDDSDPVLNDRLDRPSDALDPLLVSIARQWRLNRTPFVIVLLVNVLALGYALTSNIYTNHTFPNALPLPRPSFRTSEGRWGTDFVYYLLGGSGVPLLSMMLAIVAQVANGILFARLLGVRGSARVAICAALVSVHPFMLDYYSYSGDDLSFAIGDTLILAGVAIEKRNRSRLLVSIGLFSIALSVYQPKISLMLTVIVMTFIATALRWRRAAASINDLCRPGFANVLCAAGGAALYVGELRLKEWFAPPPGTAYFGERTRMADISGMLASTKPLLVNLRDRLFFESDVFPRSVEWLMAFLALSFAVLAVRRIRGAAADRRSSPTALALLLVSALLMPFCLYAAQIISAYWSDAARFYVPFAYLLAFLALMCGDMLRGVWPRRVWTVLTCLLVASFVVRDAEILHRAYLSTTQELSIVARVVERVQSNPRYGSVTPHSLVVFGEPPHSWPELSIGGGGIVSNFERRGFADFRQVEALNFYAGEHAFKYPTLDEIDFGAGYAAAHATWPSAESVAILDSGIVVVVFDRPGPGVSQTSAFGQTEATAAGK
jgi:hypothetical protein